MSIFIKGMEMPKNCDSCPCYYETEGAWRNECEVLQREHYITDERPDWCPLVEIPPHGRLIDVDKFKEEFPHDEDWDYPVNTNSYVVETIDKSPTIIEAEEGE